jgi:hypothetical protein
LPRKRSLYTLSLQGELPRRLRLEDPMTWYIAERQDCDPVLPQPFRSASDRDAWADAHSQATGHSVTRRTEPAPTRIRWVP